MATPEIAYLEYGPAIAPAILLHSFPDDAYAL